MVPSGSRGGCGVALTHQEAHEVEGENGGHAPEGQALQHGAADAGRVAVVPRAGAVAVLLAGTTRRLADPEGHGHGHNQHLEEEEDHVSAASWRRT